MSLELYQAGREARLVSMIGAQCCQTIGLLGLCVRQRFVRLLLKLIVSSGLSPEENEPIQNCHRRKH